MTEKEFNECVTNYADNVYRFILKNLRHEEDARDVVQTAFEKLWKCREEVQAIKSKSYLFYHRLSPDDRSYPKSEKGTVTGRVQGRVESGGNPHPAQDLKKILEKGLARLNETQRSLVLLKDYEGYSYEEIGQITGLNESQVKVYLHRARLQLKKLFWSAWKT